MLAQLNWTRLVRGLLPVLLLALAAGRTLADESGRPLSSDGTPQRLVLALDGIPYEVFADLQRQGHFADFKPAAKMVSTFPSLSDVAFAAIGGAEPPDGYQVMRFDPAQNKVVGNTIGSLGSRAHSRDWVDSANHSSLHRMVGYMAAYSMALRDLHQIGQDFLLSDRQTYVAMLGQSDSVLHIDGRVSLRAGRTLRLTADGVRLANAEWGSRAEMLAIGRLTVEVGGALVFDETLTLPFQVEP